MIFKKYILSIVFLLFTFKIILSQGSEQPNFIIIVADDLGYGDLASFENKIPQRGHPLHWHFYDPWGGPQSLLREGNWILTST